MIQTFKVKILGAESISTLTPEAEDNTPLIASQPADNIADTPLLSGTIKWTCILGEARN